MEKDKNTRDLENFVRKQLDSLHPEPDADTWSKIAGQQAPLNGRLRMRFYAVRLAVVTGTLLVAWAVWHFSSAKPASNTPETQEINRNYAGGTNGAEMLQPENGTSIIDEKNAAHKTGGRPHRPDWYRTNTVPAQTARFNSEQGIQYQSPVSGNTVRIPGNALVYADGSPVTGPVDLLFREYRTIADFLAAGMPMHYADRRGAFYFNSGGMFEVRVSQNGSDVYVAPGRNYEVDFVPTANLSNASLFYLPDSSNQWGHIRDENNYEEEPVGHGMFAGSTGAAPQILTEGQVADENRRYAERNCLPDVWTLPENADAVAWLQEGIVLGREYAYGKIYPPLWFRKNSAKPDAFFLWALDRSNVRIVHESDVDQRFFPDDLENVFTELSAFKGYYFTWLTDTTNALWRPDPDKSVYRLFSQARNWKKVTIYPQKGANCNVIFGDEKEEITIPSRLCRSNDRINDVPFNPSAVFDEYQRLLNVRHENISKEIAQWRRFIALADMWQTQEEWCMPVNVWFDYFDGNKEIMQHRYDSLYQTGMVTNRTLAAAAIAKWKAQVREVHLKRMAMVDKMNGKMDQMSMTLKLTGFGMHNWDQIFQVAAQTKYISPRYRTLEGGAITPMSTRIVDRERRLFFSMPSNTGLLNLPGRLMDVIVTATDGRVYYLSGTTYAGLALENKKEFTFKMEDVTDKVGSPLGWAELLGI